MVWHRHALLCGTALAMMAGIAPAAAEPWVRGFVVSEYEYAFRYGGRADFKRGTEIEPGVDCPHGSTVYFSDFDQTRAAISRQKWRSQQEIDWVVNPPELDKARLAILARRRIWDRAISYRGYKRGIETYVNPWAAEDPGQPQVTSRIGLGFNLDGKNKPNDFVSPEGEKGIDNALYRAWGCDAPWRGKGNATLYMRANDKMMEGLFTMVIRISGNKDPMNDPDAIVEIGYSPDQIVRDARNSAAVDYSFRILKTVQYTKLKATIKNGVVETEQVDHMHAPRISWFYNQTGDTNFSKGKIRLNLALDGQSATGLMGGYRNWRDLYAENSFAQDAGRQAIRDHEDAISLYYALRRNADGMYNEKTKRYDGISTAYRLKMSSAYVMDPDKPMTIAKVPQMEASKIAFEAIKQSTIVAVDTRKVQPVPPGTMEAGFPAMEDYTVDLPSRDYFLKTLDRPHYADEDANGFPPWVKRQAANPQQKQANKEAD